MKNKLVLKLLAMGLVALIGMAPMSAYAATPIYHVHSGSEASGTGCYSKTIYHKHTGDSSNGEGCYTTANYHSHAGDSSNGEGCYTTANYHSHTGDSASGGGCYGEPIYHVHSGNSASGGGCYTVVKSKTETRTCSARRTAPSTSVVVRICTKCNVERNHTWYQMSVIHNNCGLGTVHGMIGDYVCNTCGNSSFCYGPDPRNQNYDENHSYSATVTYYELGCGKTPTTVDGYKMNCGKTTSTIESYSLGCGKTTSTVDSYSLGCGKTTSTIESYSLGCGKVTTTIEGYALGCGKTTSTIEGYKDEPNQNTGNTGNGDDGNTGSSGNISNENNNGETGSSTSNKENEVTNITKEQGKADTAELDENDVVGNKSYTNPSNLVIQTGVNGSAGNEGISGSESGAGEELNKESMNVVEPAAGVGLVMNPGVLAGVGVVVGGLGAGFFLLFGLLGSTQAILSIVTIKGAEERKIKIKNKKNFYLAKISNKWIEYASSASIQLDQEFIDKHRGEQLKVIIDDTEYVTTVSENITFDLT